MPDPLNALATAPAVEPALVRSNAAAQAWARLRRVAPGGARRLAPVFVFRGVKVLALVALAAVGVVLWLAAAGAAAVWVLVVRRRSRPR